MNISFSNLFPLNYLLLSMSWLLLYLPNIFRFFLLILLLSTFPNFRISLTLNFSLSSSYCQILFPLQQQSLSTLFREISCYFTYICNVFISDIIRQQFHFSLDLQNYVKTDIKSIMRIVFTESEFRYPRRQHICDPYK